MRGKYEWFTEVKDRLSFGGYEAITSKDGAVRTAVKEVCIFSSTFMKPKMTCRSHKRSAKSLTPHVVNELWNG